jgi:hypothetical protein
VQAEIGVDTKTGKAEVVGGVVLVGYADAAAAETERYKPRLSIDGKSYYTYLHIGMDHRGRPTSVETFFETDVTLSPRQSAILLGMLKQSIGRQVSITEHVRMGTPAVSGDPRSLGSAAESVKHSARKAGL